MQLPNKIIYAPSKLINKWSTYIQTITEQQQRWSSLAPLRDTARFFG